MEKYEWLSLNNHNDWPITWLSSLYHVQDSTFMGRDGKINCTILYAINIIEAYLLGMVESIFTFHEINWSCEVKSCMFKHIYPTRWKSQQLAHSLKTRVLYIGFISIMKICSQNKGGTWNISIIQVQMGKCNMLTNIRWQITKFKHLIGGHERPKYKHF